VRQLLTLLAVVASTAVASAAANDLVGRSSFGAASASRSGLGINLEQPRHWLSDWPFINEFKRGSGWFTVCDRSMPQCRDFSGGASESNTREQARLELDADGWVKRLPAPDDSTVKFRSVSTILFQGNGGAHPAGHWVVHYDGEGQIEYAGAGTRVASASRPGRDVVAVTNTTPVGLIIRIKRIAAENHLRNIRVIPPGGICTDAPLTVVSDASACASHDAWRSMEQLEATQLFHPAFLADLRGFRVIRFMQWANTINSTLSTWAERPKPGDAFWSSDRGVPLEVMLALASAVNADPWLNVAPYVDDDHVRRLARLAKASVRAPRLLYFEYGNEPWNGAPPYNVAGEWYERQARQKWPDAAATPVQLRMNWYAYRAVQLCRIAKAEFGADAKRVRCVANGQASSAFVSDTMLECALAAEELGGRCSRDFDALGIAPYFGYYIGLPTHAAVTQRWPDEPDGGLATLFRELTGRDAAGREVAPPLQSAGSGAPRGAIEVARGYMVENKKIADKHGLPLIAYEGGQHLQTHPGRVADLFAAANRDPRMALALARHFDGWQAAGGELYVPYTYVKRAGASGSWGLKEYQRDEDAPKWQAVRARRDQPCWWKGCAR